MSSREASARRALANWLWLIVAQVVVRGVAFGYKAFLARALGSAGYGQYAWVVTTVMLFSVLTEAGFSRLLIRDIARDRGRAPQLLGAVTRVRLWLALGVFVILLAMFRIVPVEQGLWVGLLVVGLTLFVGAAGLTFDAAYYGVEEARYSGVGQIIVTFASAALGIAAVLLGFGLPGLFAGVVFSEALKVLYLYVYLGKVELRPDWRASLPMRPLLKDAVPYAVLGLLGMIYFRIDTVMLLPIRGDVETGVYSVAFKVLEVLMFVPGTLAAVILPRMARYHEDDAARLAASHVRLTRLLFGVGVPMTAALWVVSPLVTTVFGAQYAASVPVLRILAFAFFFHCLHTPNATLVLSGTVLGPVVWLSVYTTACNVILNAIFIPRYGAQAAAATTLATEVISWIVFTIFVHLRIVYLRGWLEAMGRPFLATAATALVVWLVANQGAVSVVGSAAIVGLTYGLCFWAAGVLAPEDVAMLRRPTPIDLVVNKEGVDLA